MRISAQPLTPEAFAPFGQVFSAPREPARLDNPIAMANRREHAAPTMILVRVAPSALPLTAKVMERHPFSSQAFVPMNVSRYLVVVAPKLADGGPDVANVRAFIAGSGQGVNYNPGTWHHGVTVLDRAADFAVIMWYDGTESDTEFLDLPQRFEVGEPS